MSFLWRELQDAPSLDEDTMRHLPNLTAIIHAKRYISLEYNGCDLLLKRQPLVDDFHRATFLELSKYSRFLDVEPLPTKASAPAS